MHTGYPKSVELNGEMITESHDNEEQKMVWSYERESSTLLLNLPDR